MLKRGTDSLSDQIYGIFKKAIQQGQLQPGSKLPSTREISEKLGVSRPTVFVSIDQLAMEGYIEVRSGSGVYVREHLNFEQTSAANTEIVAPLSRYAQFLQNSKNCLREGASLPEPEISFYPWRPAFDQFPKTGWARQLGREGRNIDVPEMDLTKEPQGSRSLRKQISQLVSKYRGLECSEDQVILTMGLNNALDLVGRMHLETNSQVLVEDPGYHLARQIFGLTGAVVRPGPLDDEGMLLPRTKTKIDLAYITPSHQFPTGITMSLKRRLEILAWSAENKTIIAEDDYDSEYQIGGKPVPALMSLDKNGLVLYVGTFNQLMFPGLSLGYLIVPPQLVELYVAAKGLSGEPLPQQLQNAVCDFIEQGELERHMRKLKSAYTERRNTLVEELSKVFGKRVEVSGQEAGVFILARFNSNLPEKEVQRRAARQDVGILSTSIFYQNQKKWTQGEFILGYGNLTPAQIRDGVQRLKAVFG